MTLVLLAFALTALPTPDDDTPPPVPDVEEAAPIVSVTLLPLMPSRGITQKQAQGVTVALRDALSALDAEGAIKLLKPTKDDDKVVRKCAAEVACYGDVAAARAADRAVYGTVSSGDGALRVTAVTVDKDGTAPRDTREQSATGDDAITAKNLDRLVRDLLAPHTLRGTLDIKGQAGDIVTVDGTRRGAISVDGSYRLPRLREGRYTVVVSRPEGNNGELYGDFERDVTIVYGETVSLKATLLPRDSTENLGKESGEPVPVLAIVGVAAGGALLAAGAVVGVLTLLDAEAVKDRAEQQQLVFPRDQELVEAGRTKSVVANVLYGAGAVVASVGIAWWLLAPKVE